MRIVTISALSSVSLAALALVAAPASAQTAPAAETPGPDPVCLNMPEGSARDRCLSGEVELESGVAVTEATDRQTVVVTGSRIRKPNLDSAIPIMSIGGEEFIQQAQTNVGDTLNELPQLRSTFAQQNPGLSIGVAGLNLLDLRGLGTVRTLVLVNGRRHVGSDILSNATSVDVNTIPNDLIERVDLVTGGNSAVYGSDAIAGVVNFILKRNYDGLQVRGSAGVSTAGFGGNQYISAMYGKNFADGRANVTIHAEHAHQDRVYGSDVPWLRQNDGFGIIDVDTAGLPQGSDGFPDRALLRDFRSASINRFGLIPITQPTTNPLCGTGLGPSNGAPSTVGGLPYNCTYIFTPDGQLVPQTGTRIGQGIIGSIIGGNGQTGREDKLMSVIPMMDRYNFNLLGHFTVSDAFEPFVEAKFVRIDAQGSNAGPSFIQGQITQFDFRERVRLDNPFLTPAQRTEIANLILASGFNPSLTARSALTTAQRNEINAGTYRFVIARHLADSGIRDERFNRETYRGVVGVRGTFNEDWNYEVTANYGKFKEKTTTFGYLDRQRFMLAMDAGRDPATGQIRCRAQYDPASAVILQRSGLSPALTAALQAKLAADIAACVPYNPFGGKDNSASANYFTYNAHHNAEMSQLDFLGFVTGDMSQLFELPGGPVRFAVGAEYRRDKALYRQDPNVELGLTNAVVIPTFAPDPFTVKEAFAELQVPIAKDLPFIHELSVTGAARVSSYGKPIGTVWAYNAGGEFAPVRDLRFRANFSRSVRAPNLSETSFPLVPNFAPGFVDPCSSGQLANNPSRLPLCQQDLGPLLAGLPNVTKSLPVISGSNPNLTEEKSNSLTLGVVAQPRFIPGLSVSADYYDIEVKDVIVSLGAQAIANNCYDQGNLTNQFCALFTRWRGPGTGPFGEVPGEILGNSLIQAGVNFAKRTRRGIDIEAAYRTDFGPVRFDTRMIYTHNFEINNFQDPSFPDLANRILGELGDPVDEFRWDVSLTKGPVTFGYQMSYIGPMWVSAYEDWNAFDQGCTPSGCPPFNSDWADIKKYPAVLYHDVRLDFNIKRGGAGRDFLFYVGMDNATNKKPPLGATALGRDSAIYAIRGRQVFAGFRARF